MKSLAEQSSALTFIDRAGHARHPRKKPPCGLSLPRLRPFSFLVTRKREIEAGAKRRLADEYDVALAVIAATAQSTAPPLVKAQGETGAVPGRRGCGPK
jgi:hypothetical protein